MSTLIRNILIIAVIAGTAVVFTAKNSESRTRSSREKRMYCEQHCRDYYWRCKLRAEKYEGKKRERTEIICANHYQGCMRRCQRYQY
ncbi:MAG TPA: hypothetical protein PK544_07735 [Spirochaetota bacterium]|nr:hypothetical protein [Spirochaetota bacterium]HPJ38601.1 hypothetical protein [Spirochaetota bacterium]HPQ54460.1 hypothetical protein [Spirochaetota bacterium]